MPEALSEAQRARHRDEGYLALGRIASDAYVAALCAEEARFRPRFGYGAKRNRTLLVSAQLCHRSEPVRPVLEDGHSWMVAGEAP